MLPGNTYVRVRACNCHLRVITWFFQSGEYDALLTWPFNLKVTLTLLDQSPRRRHLTDQFVPDPTSSSFQRPSGEMNVASGCPLFVSQSLVENPDNGYVMDDTIFIRISVGQNTTTLSPTD